MKNRIKGLNIKPEDPTPERYITRAEGREIVEKLEKLPYEELEQLDRVWQACQALAAMAAATTVAPVGPGYILKDEEYRKGALDAMNGAVQDFLAMKISDAHKALGAAKLMFAHWRMCVDDGVKELQTIIAQRNN